MPTALEKAEAAANKLQKEKDDFLAKHKPKAVKAKAALDKARAEAEAASIVDGLSDAQRQAVAAEIARTN